MGEANFLEMGLENASDFSDEGRRIAAIAPGPSLRIEDGFQFLDDEGWIVPTPKDRTDHAYQRHDPGEGFEILV
ncbi:MAG TPA: hypothetical protein VME69_11950 [Methylocella sp.]|nr:hypothetical protein [Methylocella sp.]